MPGNIAAQDQQIVRDELHTSIAALMASNMTISEMLAVTNAKLQALVVMLAKEYEQSDIDETVPMNSVTEYEIRRQGRRYVTVFAPVAVPACVLNMRGVLYTFPLAAGWNNLGSPDGSRLTMPALAVTTTVNIIIKATNWMQLGAI